MSLGFMGFAVLKFSSKKVKLFQNRRVMIYLGCFVSCLPQAAVTCLGIGTGCWAWGRCLQLSEFLRCSTRNVLLASPNSQVSTELCCLQFSLPQAAVACVFAGWQPGGPAPSSWPLPEGKRCVLFDGTLIVGLKYLRLTLGLC